MPTFLELQQQLLASSNRRTILQYLVEYIDANFKASAGSQPKLTLKMDDGRPVPQEAFESVITDILLRNIEVLDSSIQQVTSSTLQPTDTQESQHG